MTIYKIGVVGAGVIGRGVAQLFAQNGYDVVLVDIEQSILAQARDGIAKGLRLSSMTDAQLRGVNHDEILSRISFVTEYHHLSDVGFLVENVTENWDIKVGVYKLIDQYCPADCVIAVNTSAIPIAGLAELTSRPSFILGIHFMNPVPKKEYFELIRSKHTSPRTVEITASILERVNKKAIFVNDKSGFVSNRVMMLMINEAIATYADGVATAEDVDRVFVHCFAHKMGPLATADLIGLDTILNTLDVLHDNYKHPKFEACQMLREMVSSGRTGRKSGLGFFKYHI